MDPVAPLYLISEADPSPRPPCPQDTLGMATSPARSPRATHKKEGGPSQGTAAPRPGQAQQAECLWLGATQVPVPSRPHLEAGP